MALLQPSLQPNCGGLTDLFFDDDENIGNIFECRSVCVTCPIFEECARYSIEHYPDVKNGVFAGYPASTRQAIYEGTHELVDWRESWDPTRRVVEGLAPVEIQEPCQHHPRLKLNEDGSRSCVVCGARVRLMPRR